MPKSFVNFNVTYQYKPFLLPSIESEPFLHTPRFHISSRAGAAGTTFYQPSRMLLGQGWAECSAKGQSAVSESCFHFPCLFPRHNFRTDLPFVCLLSRAMLRLENLDSWGACAGLCANLLQFRLSAANVCSKIVVRRGTGNWIP